MRETEYIAPRTLDEAVAALAGRGDRAQVLAGGTDLLPRMNRTGGWPSCLISLKKLEELRGFECTERGLVAGALVTMRELEKSPRVRARYSALAQACALVGPVQNRSRATLGGNLCNASPAADTAPALIVLDAQLQVLGPNGTRTVPVAEFFTGPGATVLQRGELLVRIDVATMPGGFGSAYLRWSPRKAMDISVVGVAASVTLGSDGRTCSDVRLALASVAPRPLRAVRAEQVLRSRAMDDPLVREAAEVAISEASPIDDVRGSAEFRSEMIRVFVTRALQQAASAARSDMGGSHGPG